jgi:hypothetical protein
MKPARSFCICICPKTLTWSPNLRRIAMPACLQHESDRQGRGYRLDLPIHATENRL